MDRIEVLGVSGRTQEPTLYVYDIVTLTLANPLPEGVFGGAYAGFLKRRGDPRLRPGRTRPEPKARGLHWTTWQSRSPSSSTTSRSRLRSFPARGPASGNT